MKDKQFLKWIHARLVDHGENPNFDYMHKLRVIIESIDENQVSSNVAMCNGTNYAELAAELDKDKGE